MAEKLQPAKKHGFIRRTFFDVGAWLSWDLLKLTTRYFIQWGKFIVKPRADDKIRKEHFEDAVKRFNLSEEDIQQRLRFHSRVAMIFSSLGVLGLVYTLYLVTKDYWFAVLLAFAASVIALARAFQSSFWAFQIKHRKLGCTLREWFRGKTD